MSIKDYDIFLSYSSKNKKEVLQLANDLISAGVSVWLDEWEIKVGDPVAQKIQTGIENCRYLGIWITKDAMESGWIEKEWQAKFDEEVRTRRVTVLPLLGERCQVPVLLRDKKYADFSHDYQQGLDELLMVFGFISSKRGRTTGHGENIRREEHNEILDQTLLIEEKTRNFVGRQFVFKKLYEFIEKHSCGYFTIRGDAGIGKTALAAQWVKESGCLYHFNNRAEGINTADLFLRNICAQLLASYDLNYKIFSVEQAQRNEVLKRLLKAVAEKLASTGDKLLILVDALDEVDLGNLGEGANILYLPTLLPNNVYIITTIRRGVDVPFRIECDQEEFLIDYRSSENNADITKYLEQSLEWTGIKAYIAAHTIDGQAFVAHMLDKSEGNFMYLRHVLPEIEAGAYTDWELIAIPQGLVNYYQDHWQRMRHKDEDTWYKYKLPVVVALTVVPEPVSIQRIMEFSGVTDRTRICAVLQEWKQFLHEIQSSYEGDLQTRYCMYHASFYEFLKDKEQVKDERVNLLKAKAQMIDTISLDILDAS